MNQGRCNVLKSNKTAPHAPSRDERPDEEERLDNVLVQHEPGEMLAIWPEDGEEAGVGPDGDDHDGLGPKLLEVEQGLGDNPRRREAPVGNIAT